MNRNDRELRKYYREVGSRLTGTNSQKRLLVAQIKERVGIFLQEQPEADIDAVIRHFGTPQQIAQSYLEQMDAPELLGKLRIRKRIVTIVAVAAIVALAMWGIAVGWAMYDAHEDAHWYYETFIEEN